MSALLCSKQGLRILCESTVDIGVDSGKLVARVDLDVRLFALCNLAESRHVGYR